MRCSHVRVRGLLELLGRAPARIAVVNLGAAAWCVNYSDSRKKEKRGRDVRHWSQFPRWRRWAGWGTEITSTLTAAETVTKVNLLPSTGAGLTGSRPWRWGGRLGVFIPFFSLKFRRLCVERSVFSVSRIHLFSVTAPWCPAHQHPRCRNLFYRPEMSPARPGDRGKTEQVVIRACAPRPRQAVCCASGSNPDTCRLRPPLSPAWRSRELPPFKPPVAPRRPALNFESVRGTAALLPLTTHTHFAQLIPIITVDSKDYYGLTDLHDRLWGAF